MLYVLFGMTAKVGQICRHWFVSRGVPIIQKKCYVPDDFPLTTYHEPRNKVSLEEVLACDYTYENNGMIVGFNKAEILDAVRGRCDRLLTGSAHNVGFVENIKRGFGEYVTTICTYIEQPVLEQMTEALPNITRQEVALRVSMGGEIKALLRDNRELFDEVVLYSGEGTAFDYQALALQLDQIVTKAKILQRKLNDMNYVEAPYTGSKPYTFISYAHADRPRIDMVFNHLQGKGCRIWYDDDMINWAGSDWRDIVIEKLIASTQCILFSSRCSAASDEVDTELHAMIEHKKPIITIRVDDSLFRPSREAVITKKQILFMTDQRFYDGLIRSIDKTTRVMGLED